MKKPFFYPLIIITICGIFFMLGTSFGQHSTYSVTRLTENKKSVIQNTDVNQEADDEPWEQNQQNKININTADTELLCFLPGIGETLAKRIVEYRTKNGPFKSVEDLMNIEGFGEKKLQSIINYITVD